MSLPNSLTNLHKFDTNIVNSCGIYKTFSSLHLICVDSLTVCVVSLSHFTAGQVEASDFTLYLSSFNACYNHSHYICETLLPSSALWCWTHLRSRAENETPIWTNIVSICEKFWLLVLARLLLLEPWLTDLLGGSSLEPNWEAATDERSNITDARLIECFRSSCRSIAPIT